MSREFDCHRLFPYSTPLAKLNEALKRIPRVSKTEVRIVIKSNSNSNWNLKYSLYNSEGSMTAVILRAENKK